MVSDATNMTVKQIIRQCPESGAVFRLLSISPDVELHLVQIADTRGWPADILPVVLESARATPKDDSPSDRLKLRLHRSIVTYVRDRYHQPLEGELERIESLLADTVESCHPGSNDRIRRIRSVFMRLSKQLRVHVGIEDDLLFPNLYGDGRTGTHRAGHGAGEVPVAERALREMDKEHDILDTCLQDITELTDGYAPASGDGRQIVALYEELRAFDFRLRQHVTVEHDFLWPTTARAGDVIETEPVPVSDTGADLKERLCPRTQQACEEGHPNICRRLWDCLQDVLDARWNEASRDTERPNGL